MATRKLPDNNDRPNFGSHIMSFVLFQEEDDMILLFVKIAGVALAWESVIESTEKNIFADGRSTQVNRLTNDICIVIFIIAVRFIDYVSDPANMYYSSNCELDVTVIWIWSFNNPAFFFPRMKSDLIPISELDKERDIMRENCSEEVFPLLSC